MKLEFEKTMEKEKERRQEILLKSYGELLKYQLDNYNQLKTRTAGLLAVSLGFSYFVAKEFTSTSEFYNFFQYTLALFIGISIMISVSIALVILWSRKFLTFPHVTDIQVFQDTQWPLSAFLDQLLNQYKCTIDKNKKIFSMVHRYFNYAIISFATCIFLTLCMLLVSFLN